MRTVAALALVVAVTLAQGNRHGENIDDAVREVVKAAFARLDTDKDGVWSSDELAKELGGLDADGDGRLTWKEFKNDVENNTKDAFSTYGRSSIMEAHEKAAFACITGPKGYIPIPVTMEYFQPWYDTDSDDVATQDESVIFHVKVFLENVKGTNKCP